MGLEIEAFDSPQEIIIGTSDYELEVGINGSPTSVRVKGFLEGFDTHWASSVQKVVGSKTYDGTLYIRADEVTILVSGVSWDVELEKNTEELASSILYNVVNAMPNVIDPGTIHLYQDVDISFGIVVQNNAPIVSLRSDLVGLVAETVEYGVNIRGRLDSTHTRTFTSGDIRLVLQMPDGTESNPDGNPNATPVIPDRWKFDFEIETGTPPALGAVTVTPFGESVELSFADVTNAFGYEYNLDGQWNYFDTTREIIDVNQIEVEHGNLEVTVKFPQISNASFYEYQLTSGELSGDWTSFFGTVSNSMVSIVIPNLIEGVEYTLQLRVGAPWIGVPVTVTFRAGRSVYIVNDDGANSAIYLVNTGTLLYTVPRVLKKVFLPTEIADPRGLVILDGDAYVLDRTDYKVYVIDFDGTVDGARATLSKTIVLPSSSRPYSLRLYDGDLIVSQTVSSGGDPWYFYSFDPETANNATAVVIKKWHFSADLRDQDFFDVSNDVFYFVDDNGPLFVGDYNSDGVLDASSSQLVQLPAANRNVSDMIVLDNKFYTLDVSDNLLYIWPVYGSNLSTPSSSNLDLFGTPGNIDYLLRMPAGVLNPYALFMHK